MHTHTIQCKRCWLLKSNKNVISLFSTSNTTVVLLCSRGKKLNKRKGKYLNSPHHDITELNWTDRIIYLNWPFPLLFLFFLFWIKPLTEAWTHTHTHYCIQQFSLYFLVNGFFFFFFFSLFLLRDGYFIC